MSVAGVREPGGPLPPIGELLSETLADVRTHFEGYLMVGLAHWLVLVPVSVLFVFGAMLVMYAVMGVGIVFSVGLGEGFAIAGNRDLRDVVVLLGSVFSIGGGLLLFFVGITGLAAAFAPLNASVMRAIAAHQRGDAPLRFDAAFATLRQDLGATIGVALLTGLLSVVGVLFCYVGALVAGVFFGFAPSLVALHRRGPWEAVGIAARHALARPGDHLLMALTLLMMQFVAAYVPVLGHAFVLAFSVRAFRKMYGDDAAVA